MNGIKDLAAFTSAGGFAAAKALTPEERAQRARNAILARWAKPDAKQRASAVWVRRKALGLYKGRAKREALGMTG